MGSSGGGSSGSGDSTNTVRYASYIETKHSSFLTTSKSAGSTARAANPFSGITDLDFDDAFFGTGMSLSSYDAMFDLFGEYMTGFNVDTLWETTLSDVQNNAAISNLVTSQAELLDEQIEQITLPRFQTGMRDMNSVISSSFTVGESVIETSRNHDVAKFSAEVKYKLIPVAQDRWAKTLSWNESVIKVYANILQFYINVDLATDDRNADFDTKKALWPFTVLDYERANLGALQGAMSSVYEGPAGASQAQRSIGGLFGGASLGGDIGGGWGAAGGGILGLASSFF